MNWEHCQELIPSLPAHIESIRWLRYCDHCLEVTYIAANDRMCAGKLLSYTEAETAVT
jgi:hypothetical protein